MWLPHCGLFHNPSTGVRPSGINGLRCGPYKTHRFARHVAERVQSFTVRTLRGGSTGSGNMKYGRGRPWPFEREWRGRLNLATKVMRDLQDSWLRSKRAFPSREVAAVLIRIFSISDPGRSEDWARRPADWLSFVGSPEDECDLLNLKSSQAIVDAAVQHLCSILSVAAKSWETRTITDPSVEALVSDLLNSLSADSILKLHYG